MLINWLFLKTLTQNYQHNRFVDRKGDFSQPNGHNSIWGSSLYPFYRVDTGMNLFFCTDINILFVPVFPLNGIIEFKGPISSGGER